MGAIHEEFAEQLERWRERYRHRPRAELDRLLLVAIEREQLVTVAYRNDVMARRLEALALSDEMRRVFLQSLGWAWKDEQMHAIFTRGLLLRVGSPWLKGKAFIQQMAGAVGGWASSVKQHAPFSQAPISRALAGVVAFAGRLTGRVPRAVRKELQLLSFHAFCRMQVDAERTAACCWRRLTELAELLPSIDEQTASEFRRMWQDEERHRRVFQIIADALEDEDGIRDDTDETSPIENLRKVSEFFLPRELRSGEASPLGAGGPVWVLQGDGTLDKKEAFRRLLEESTLTGKLESKLLDSGKSSLRVVVKPTFMLGYHRDDKAIVTDPELVEELAVFLRERGCDEVIVAEGRNLYDHFFHNRSVEAVARYFGFDSNAYGLADLSEDQVRHDYSRGMAQDTVSRLWRDADFRIAFCKMRSHPVDFTHLTIAGLEGVGAPIERFLFFERQAHRDTALLMPLAEFPPDFALVDGYESAADGLVGIIACPDPPRPFRFYAGEDALAVDMVCTRHLGLSNPRDCLVLDAACHWFGDPTPRTEVLGLDEPVSGWRHPHHNELTTLLSLLSYPVYQFASGRGASFLPPMDEEAFPPKKRPGFLEKAERWLVRKLVGMRPPA